jgi:oxygen-dependent protoporphyrinogen oxidase
MRIAVIGGGTAGAAAAATIRAAGRDVVVFERDLVGGRTRTVRLGDRPVDVGAQFLTNFYTKTLALLHERRAGDQLQRIPPSLGLALDGRIHDLLSPRTALGNRVVPWAAKLAVLPEALLALTKWRSLDVQALWRASSLDTGSLAEAYSHGRGSRLLLERVVAPAVDNFLYWDPASTTRALSPALVKGAIILRRMWTLCDGVGSLPGLLLGDIPVRTGTRVIGVREEPRGVLVTTANGREELFDGAVIATTAPAVTEIWPDAPASVRDLLAGIDYSRTTVVSALLDRRVQVPTAGVMFAGGSEKAIAAVTVASHRSPHMLPGTDVLQVFSTDAAAQRWADLPDHDVLERAGDALTGLHGGELDPRAGLRALHIQRWEVALPRFRPGSLVELRKLQPWLNSPGRVRIAGDYLSGPFIEGAVTTGVAAAQAVLSSQPVR